MVMRNNYLENIGGSGIVLLGADGAIIEGKVVNGAGRGAAAFYRLPAG